MIKLLLVDDEELIRSALAVMLDTYQDIEVVGQAADGQEAYEFCQNNQVDFVLMDIRMPKSSGVEGTQIILKDFPDIKVLMLTTFNDAEYISQAMKAGASGYLLKDNSHADIYEGIKVACSDKVVLDSRVSTEILSQSSASVEQSFDASQFDLNDREIRIIREIASGLNNKEIATTLYLSEGTVRNNVSNILDKLYLRDRTQLAIFAFKEGLMG